MSLIDNSYAAYVNLDIRKDRFTAMVKELKRVGINAERTRGIPVNELPGNCETLMPAMWKRVQKGAMGCFLSQTSIMKEALKQAKHAFVMEDDCQFATDILSRIDYISKFTETHSWDMIWLGGTFHADIPQWHNKVHHNLKGCKCDLNRDFEFTDDERIVRTYGCWGTYAYIVNKNSIEKVLALLDKHLHETIGIDWSFIRVQPQLKCYAFVPGCVKQYDSESDIGSGMTYFSNFERLGGHWWANKMEDYTPEQFRNDVLNRGKEVKYRHELIKLIRYYNLPETVVEIGVGRGDFSLEILQWGIDELYLIDSWEHQPDVKGDSSEPQEWHDDNYKKTQENTEPYSDKVIILKGYSKDAATFVNDNSIGLLYLDGNHAYEYVMDDLKAWYSKVVEGGIIAGHDYLSPAYGVKQAVEDFCRDRFEIHLIPDVEESNSGFWFQKKQI